MSGRTRQRRARARAIVARTNAIIRRLNALHDDRNRVWAAAAGRTATANTAHGPGGRAAATTPRRAPAVVQRLLRETATYLRAVTRERGSGAGGEHQTPAIGDAAATVPTNPTTLPRAHDAPPAGVEATTTVGGTSRRPPRQGVASGGLAMSVANDHPPTTNQPTGSAATAGPVRAEDMPVPTTDVADDPLGYGASTPYAPLVAEQVSLPKRAGGVPLTRHMPARHAAMYESPEAMLASAEEMAARGDPDPRPRVGGKRSEYVALTRRCLAAGMWTLYSGDGPPPVINGLFARRKDENTLRLIYDARAANRRFKVPPAVALPTPDVVCELHVEGGGELHVGKTDLSDFYYQLELPEWMTDHFALPPLRRSELFDDAPTDHSLVYPKSRVLPMGWSFSVHAAQVVHENLMERAGVFRAAPPLTRYTDGVVRVGRPRSQCYVDDVIVYGARATDVDSVQDTYTAAIDDAELRVKRVKTVRARSHPPVPCVGLAVDGREHTAGVSPSALEELASDTRRLLRGPTVAADDVVRLVGRWNWAVSAQRSAFAVLSNAYRFAHAASRAALRGQTRVRVWRSARLELEALHDLAPLLHTSLNAPVSTTVVASDASTEGFGATVTDLPDATAVRRAAAECMGAHTLALLARARQDRPSDARATARATLSALSRAADDGGRPGGGPEWRCEDLPCAVAATTGREQRDALDAQRYADLRVLTVPPGHPLGGLSRAYRRWVLGRPHWTVALSGRWDEPDPDRREHINAKEIRAAYYGLNEALRRGCGLGSRVLLFTDSSVALSALTKGRSASFALLRCVRRCSALLLATGVRPLYRFVESEGNPSDAPSRAVMPRGTRLRYAERDPHGHGGGWTPCL